MNASRGFSCTVPSRGLLSRLALAASLLTSAAIRADDTITVYPGVVYQTFRGFGGNFAQDRLATTHSNIDPTTGLDPYAEFCLANLNVKHARVGLPLRVFETSDGVFDYNATNVVHVLNLMKYMQNHGIPFIASIWDLPNWMVDNPQDDAGRTIKAGYEDKVAQCIVTFLNKANTSQYAFAVPDAISFNECTETWGNDVVVPSGKLNTIMTKLAAKSGGAGLKWILNDTGADKGTSYAQPCWNAMTSANQGRVIAVAYHGWKSAANTASITALFNFAQSINKPLWNLEVGEDPQATNTDWETWAFASATAKNYYYGFKFGHVERADYWEYMQGFRLTDVNATTFTSAGYVVKMLNDYIPNAFVMVNSAGTGNGAYNVAFKHPTDGRLRVFFINTAATQNISFASLPAGTYTLRRCSASQNNVQIGTYTVGTGGTLTLNSVPMDSVNILWK